MKPRIPRRLFAELALSLARGERRSLLADTARMAAVLPRPPRVSGREHLPAGAYVLVANHYQRWDLWIGWAGSLLIQATGRPVHWLALRELRLRGREVPLTRRLFTRVARTYGFIPTPADLADHAGQAAAIRQAVRLLRAGEVVGFFPEGPSGRAGALGPPLPGTPKLACLLARWAPLVPAAVWEEDGRLCAAFGPPVRPVSASASDLLEPVRRLLPQLD